MITTFIGETSNICIL